MKGKGGGSTQRKKNGSNKNKSRQQSARFAVARGLRPRLDPMQRYRLALVDPFHPEAVGCKVPSTGTQSTLCFKSNHYGVLNSDLNGQIVGILLPNPWVTLLMSQNGSGQPAGSFSGGLLQKTPGTTTPVNWTGYIGSWNLGTAGSYFPSTVACARLVSCGVRFRNLIAFNNLTGYGAAAPFSILGEVPEALVSTTTANAGIGNYSFDAIFNTVTGAGGNAPFQTRSNPNCITFNQMDFVNSALTLKPRPTDVRQTFWKNVRRQSVNTGTTMIMDNDETWTIATDGTFARSTLGAEIENLHGFQGISFNFQGLPINWACLEVEYVFHWEAIEIPTDSTGGPLPVADRSSSTGNVMDAITHVGRPVLEFLRNTANSPEARSFISSLSRTIIGSSNNYPRLEF